MLLLILELFCQLLYFYWQYSILLKKFTCSGICFFDLLLSWSSHYWRDWRLFIFWKSRVILLFYWRQFNFLFECKYFWSLNRIFWKLRLFIFRWKVDTLRLFWDRHIIYFTFLLLDWDFKFSFYILYLTIFLLRSKTTWFLL